jgi:hypothetical protein
MEKLSGKIALVTGSSDGVGRLVARKLGQAGALVLVHEPKPMMYTSLRITASSPSRFGPVGSAACGRT